MMHWPMAEVVPHAGEMILLDDIVEAESERIVCTRTIKPGGLFVDDDGSMPSWAGVELMAQAIAAWAGCCARVEKRPVTLGFLLGTRHYACNVDAFSAGTPLRVEAVREFHDEQGMGVFHCRIEGPGVHAEARLNVFCPPDADAFYKQESGEPPHG
ncbi:hotdog family protein [Dyella nitratireducens]|uniref:3-hydroxylacyl-ACP dehydratase n=1 Tax=Dyella nitratireducens TaxID=1849580 RepID=A0ABQ1G455_9GAMM|nr:hotdog family protein [Dyella nitratireducens]GGA37171.1 3-hydroxylacyl-ACP dehydratase [Dyella nitratireducens]GLQ41164.1 3-hydroxylacyl-ACP dehydratase [Dyella nitratireducens]